MKKKYWKLSGCLLVLISTILFWAFIIWFASGCAAIVPHNPHPEPEERKGMYVTPYGVYHKSVLDDLSKYEKQ